MPSAAPGPDSAQLRREGGCTLDSQQLHPECYDAVIVVAAQSSDKHRFCVLTGKRIYFGLKSVQSSGAMLRWDARTQKHHCCSYGLSHTFLPSTYGASGVISNLGVIYTTESIAEVLCEYRSISHKGLEQRCWHPWGFLEPAPPMDPKG